MPTYKEIEKLLKEASEICWNEDTDTNSFRYNTEMTEILNKLADILEEALIKHKMEPCIICGKPTELYKSDKSDTKIKWCLCDKCEGSREAIKRGYIHG